MFILLIPNHLFTTLEVAVAAVAARRPQPVPRGFVDSDCHVGEAEDCRFSITLSPRMLLQENSSGWWCSTPLYVQPLLSTIDPTDKSMK